MCGFLIRSKISRSKYDQQIYYHILKCKYTLILAVCTRYTKNGLRYITMSLGIYLSVWGAERVRKTLMQNERLIFKNMLKYEQIRLKQNQAGLTLMMIILFDCSLIRAWLLLVAASFNMTSIFL